MLICATNLVYEVNWVHFFVTLFEFCVHHYKDVDWADAPLNISKVAHEKKRTGVLLANA